MYVKKPSLMGAILSLLLVSAILLAGCAPKPTATPVKTEAPPPPTAEQPKPTVEQPKPTEEVVTGAFDLRAISKEPIYFQGWQFATDVVQNNVDRYNKEVGGNVVYSTIAGDYSAIMESKLLLDFADVVVDNCGNIGDVCVTVPWMRQGLGPTSTIAGAYALHAIMVQAAFNLKEMNIDPPGAGCAAG